MPISTPLKGQTIVSAYRQLFDFSGPEPTPFEDGPLQLERGYVRPHPQLSQDERGEPHVYVWFDISNSGESYLERTFV